MKKIDINVNSIKEGGICLNFFYIYKKANKIESVFCKMLEKIKLEHTKINYLIMLNHEIKDMNLTSNKYPTIKEKELIIFKNVKNKYYEKNN